MGSLWVEALATHNESNPIDNENDFVARKVERNGLRDHIWAVH